MDINNIVIIRIWIKKNINKKITVRQLWANEASSQDRIKMSKFWLEYDRKFFTPTNINFGTWPKNDNDKHDRIYNL